MWGFDWMIWATGDFLYWLGGEEIAGIYLIYEVWKHGGFSIGG